MCLVKNEKLTKKIDNFENISEKDKKTSEKNDDSVKNLEKALAKSNVYLNNILF